MIQTINTVQVVNGMPAVAKSNTQFKDGQANSSNIKSVEVDVKTPKTASANQSEMKKFSKNDYVIYVCWNTLRYFSNLLAFPVIQVSHAFFNAFVYGGRAVGFASGLALGSLVGVGPALREIVRGNGCNQAFKKLSEYAVKGCCKGTSVGRVTGVVIGAPVFAITAIVVASVEISLLLGKPWLANILLGTSLAAAVLSASEVAHKGSSKINAKMNALVDKNFIFSKSPEKKEQSDESKTKNAEAKPEEKIKGSKAQFKNTFEEVQYLYRL